MIYVKRKDTGEIVKVQKYTESGDGTESIWSNEWYGRHVIGMDCEFAYRYKHKKIRRIFALLIIKDIFDKIESGIENDIKDTTEQLEEYRVQKNKNYYRMRKYTERIHTLIDCRLLIRKIKKIIEEDYR